MLRAYVLLWKFINASNRELECDFMQDFKGAMAWGDKATKAHNDLVKWCREYNAR